MKRILSTLLALGLVISGSAFSNTAYAKGQTETEIQTAVLAEAEIEKGAAAEAVTENAAAAVGDTEEESSDAASVSDAEDTIGGVTVKDIPSGSKSVVAGNKELRGLWVPFCDFYSRGLSNKNEATYTQNVKKLVALAKEYKCNVIFFHVRSHDDAVWKSKTFKASQYLVAGKKASKKASEAYSYDPLYIFIREAHKEGIELHAWLNPYRITAEKYYDPSKASSRDRVLKAVDEILRYDVDGIHFDDYFYHATKGYVTVSNKDKVKKINITSAQKRKYVNALVSAVYTKTHKSGRVFGISPQGNYENDMTSGADVKTWLSTKGYTDYVMPQIYWTDNYGSNGKIKMFTDRLNLFKKLRKTNAVKLYIGLATYRCGDSGGIDKGWKKSSNNMVKQIKQLRAAGAEGFCYFTASSFYLGKSKKELKNLKAFLNKTVKE